MQPTDAARRETQVALQEQAPNDRNKTSAFIAYPINKVVGFIDDLGDVKAALGDLRAAGFKAEDIQVFTGEEGARRIDVNGDEHGELAHIVRSIQKHWVIMKSRMPNGTSKSSWLGTSELELPPKTRKTGTKYETY
jgi:hypothetical protein